MRRSSWRRGVMTRVLTDNGFCYRCAAFADALAKNTIVYKRTRPYQPQTNGKVERFNHQQAASPTSQGRTASGRPGRARRRRA